MNLTMLPMVAVWFLLWNVLSVYGEYCLLNHIDPAVGEIRETTSVRFSIVATEIFLILNLTLDICGINYSYNVTLLASAENNIYLLELPASTSECIATITSTNCSGSLFFQYYDFGNFEIDSISKTKIKPGSSVVVSFIKEGWLLDNSRMSLRFDSLDYGNQYHVTYPLSPSYYPSRRISTLTDSILSALGRSCKLSISLDGQHFHDLPGTYEILPLSLLRIAVLYDGTIFDYGWNYAMHNGMTSMYSRYSGLISYDNFETNLYDPASIEAFASSGNFDVLLLTTTTDMRSVAEKYPDVTFLTISMQAFSHDPLLNNYRQIWGTLYEARYLAGVATGLTISRGGFACYIKAYDNSEVNQGINAFALGIRKYNPTARLLSFTINTWGDRYVEQQVAEWYLDDGRCEVIYSHSNHIDPLEMFSSHQKLGIGNNYFAEYFIGSGILASAVFNWSIILDRVFRYVIDENLGNSSLMFGMHCGGVFLSPLSHISTDSVKQIVKTEVSNIMNNPVNSYIFCGPVQDVNGIDRIPSGVCADDEMFLSMDWMVAGVENLGAFIATPPIHNDFNIGSGLKMSAYFTLGVMYLVAILLGYWVYIHRMHPVVMFAQPNCLLLVIFGCVAGISTIIPLSMSPHISDLEAYQLGNNYNNWSAIRFPFMDRCCQSIPWCLVTGFCFTFPVLFVKTYRQHVFVTMSNCSSKKAMLCFILQFAVFILYLILIIPLIYWQVNSPLIWRQYPISFDEFGNAISSFGHCVSPLSYAIMGTELSIACLVIVAGNYVLYEARGDDSFNRESLWVTLSEVNVLEIGIVATIFFASVKNNSKTEFVLQSASITGSFFGCVLLVIVPKMILVYGSSNFFSDSQAITLENVMSSKRTLQDIFTSHRPSLSSHHGSNSVRKNRKSVDVSDVVETSFGDFGEEEN